MPFILLTPVFCLVLLVYMMAAMPMTAAAIPTESTDSPATTMVSHIVSRISLTISFHIHAPTRSNYGPSERNLSMNEATKRKHCQGSENAYVELALAFQWRAQRSVNTRTS